MCTYSPHLVAANLLHTSCLCACHLHLVSSFSETYLMLQVHMQCQAFGWLTCVGCVGGAYKDAVGVCAHELGDPQLALFLARLLEGGQSPLQQHLLSQELLPGHSMLHCFAIYIVHPKAMLNIASLQITLCRLVVCKHSVKHGLDAAHSSCAQLMMINAWV